MLEQVIISVQIILIDKVMAADNAIIIGLIAAGFATDNRRKSYGTTTANGNATTISRKPNG